MMQAAHEYCRPFVLVRFRTMLACLSVGDYFKYILMTVAGRGSGDRVK
jgi:hypothetical protein